MTSVGNTGLIPVTLPEIQKPKTPEKPVELKQTQTITETEPKIKTESTVSLTEPKKEESLIETTKKVIDETVKSKTTPVLPFKVEDLELVKSGLKKVDTKKKIDTPIPMDQGQKIGAKIISEKLTIDPKDRDGLNSFIFDPSKSKFLDKFAEKEFSTENLKFLRDVKPILMNPSLRGLTNLYETQIKDLNVGGKELREFKEALNSGKLSQALSKLDGIINAVKSNASDTFARFTSSNEMVECQIDKDLKPLLSVGKEKYSLGDFLHNPKISKAFDDFAKKEHSFENVAFLHSAKKMLDKGGVPSLTDLTNLYANFIDQKSSQALNIRGTDANAFKTALESNDLVGAMKSLEKITNTVNSNANDTFSRFQFSSECKNAIKQDSINNLKDIIAPTGRLKEVLADPKKAVLFEKFAQSEFSSENLNFVKELEGILKNPDMGKLTALCNKFVKTGSSQEINISGTNRKAVLDALNTGDLTKVIQSLDGAVKNVYGNMGDTMSRFTISPELKKNILSPIDSLPLRKQLGELNKIIKEGGLGAGIASTKKKEILEKFLPEMPVTNKDDALTKFIGKFKEVTYNTKTAIFGGKIDNVTRALTNLETKMNNGDVKGCLQSLDSLKAEVDNFVKTQGNSSKIEWVEALSERISGAKSAFTEKFATTEPGKLYTLNDGLGKLMPELKFNPSNPKALDEIKAKVSEIIQKDPKGDLAWSVTTLPDDKAKAEISSLVEKSFKNLQPEQKTQISNKIFEGLQEALPIKSKPDNSLSIIINGEEYKSVKKLGEGGMGSVFKYENSKGDAVVVKTFKDPDNFLQEAEGHRLVSGKPEFENKNVSKFIGAVKDHTSGEMWTIQEFANGGDVKGLMEKLNDFKSKGILSHTDDILVRQYLAKGIVEGMVHVNDTRGMMHLDIKPENFLFDKKTGSVKVADFGLTEKNSVISGAQGTIPYMAPEVSKKGPGYDKKSDVWSTGLTINELMTGKKSFELGQGNFMGQMLKPVYDFVESGEKYSKVKKTDGTDGGANPTEYGKAINSMIVGDQNGRINFTDLKKTPFISDPIGSDERAQALINAMSDVSEKKDRFDSIPKITKGVDSIKKDITKIEKKIEETEPKDSPLIEDFRKEINDLKLKQSALELKLTDLNKEFNGLVTFEIKAEFEKLISKFSNLV